MSVGRRVREGGTEGRRGRRSEEGGRDSGGEGEREEERANVGGARFLRSSVIVAGVKGEGKGSLLSIIPRCLPTCGGKSAFFWFAAGRQAGCVFPGTQQSTVNARRMVGVVTSCLFCGTTNKYCYTMRTIKTKLKSGGDCCYLSDTTTSGHRASLSFPQ